MSIESTVTITYDPEVDAAYIYVAPERPPVDRTQAIEHAHGELIVDYAADGSIAGIEVLGASAVLPRELLTSAVLDNGGVQSRG